MTSSGSDSGLWESCWLFFFFLSMSSLSSLFKLCKYRKQQTRICQFQSIHSPTMTSVAIFACDIKLVSARRATQSKTRSLIPIFILRLLFSRDEVRQFFPRIFRTVQFCERAKQSSTRRWKFSEKVQFVFVSQKVKNGCKTMSDALTVRPMCFRPWIILRSLVGVWAVVRICINAAAAVSEWSGECSVTCVTLSGECLGTAHKKP